MTLRLMLTVWLFSMALVAGQAQHTSPPHGEAVATTKTRTTTRGSHPAPQFSHSENCMACHNNLTTPSGEDVSIGATWRSTMMANSSRDPYWQASVRREMQDHTVHAAAIEDECAACHMPMATRIARDAGRRGEVFPHPSSKRADAELRRLAADGVSCSVCHQISSTSLGSRESYNGAFVLAPTPADGVRPIFGPYRIDAGRRTIMRSVTGFVQEEAAHIKQSELCATCHTLITTALGPDGRVVGSLPEQMNYQEWLHSDFSRDGRSCQSCHMPTANGPLRIASVLGETRETLARHVFVGGNAYMVRLMNQHRGELGVLASSSELEATATATIAQLQRDTATLSISSPVVTSGVLAFDVETRNLTGHKLPTGYPARRLWLHVTVRDVGGEVVFESGAVTPAGAIVGNDNDDDPRRFERHHDAIDSPEQVEIYESILGDVGGAVTTGLLSATQYLKDNRLLPRGFDKTTASAEIDVHGDAKADADFTGGGDRVHYRIPHSAGGRLTIDVELRYQAIAYRWAHNLERYDAVEPARFLTYYRGTAADSSLAIATASTSTTDGR